jgi:hypothetical protein
MDGLGGETPDVGSSTLETYRTPLKPVHALGPLRRHGTVGDAGRAQVVRRSSEASHSTLCRLRTLSTGRPGGACIEDLLFYLFFGYVPFIPLSVPSLFP